MLILAASSHLMGLEFPEMFNFKSLTSSLDRCSRCFLQLHDGSGLVSEGQQKQVSTFLYCMRESVEDVLTSRTSPQTTAKGSSLLSSNLITFSRYAKSAFLGMCNSTAIRNRTVRRQKNLSLAFISWSTAATTVPCRTRCCATVLLYAFAIKHYRKECRWILN